MLKNGKIRKVALLAMIVSLIIMAVGCNLIKMNPDAEKKQVVAKVGEEEITKQDFNYYLTIEKLNWHVQGKEFPTDEEQLGEIKSQILDVLVENKMLEQLAKEQDVSVDEESTATQVDDMKELLKNDLGAQEAAETDETDETEEIDEKTKEEAYNNFLKENDITVKEFDEFLKNYFLSNQYIMALYEKVTEDIAISDEEVEEYYNDNINQFDPSTAEAKHILADLENKEMAEEIVQKAKDGESFDKLMEEYKEKEGILEAADLGEFNKAKMVPEFSDAAFALEEGEISGVVETEFGFHVIKLEKKNIQPVQELDEIADNLSMQLEQNAQQEAFVTYFQEQQEKLDIEKYLEKL